MEVFPVAWSSPKLAVRNVCAKRVRHATEHRLLTNWKPATRQKKTVLQGIPL